MGREPRGGREGFPLIQRSLQMGKIIEYSPAGQPSVDGPHVTFARQASCSTQLLLDTESSSVGAGRGAGVALEDGAEEGNVLVADGVADFLHGAMVAFEQPLRGGNAEFLQVDQRAVSGGLLETCDEIAAGSYRHARQELRARKSSENSGAAILALLEMVSSERSVF